jgi:hypothetical protein
MTRNEAIAVLDMLIAGRDIKLPQRVEMLLMDIRDHLKADVPKIPLPKISVTEIPVTENPTPISVMPKTTGKRGRPAADGKLSPAESAATASV